MSNGTKLKQIRYKRTGNLTFEFGADVKICVTIANLQKI